MLFIPYKLTGKYINVFSAFTILLFLTFCQLMLRITLPAFYSNFLGNPITKLLVFGLAILFSLRFFKLKSSDYFSQEKIQIPIFPFYLIIISLFLVTKIMMEFEIMATTESNDYLLSFNKQFGLSNKISLILTLLLVAPIVEEILFRIIFLKNFIALYYFKKAIIYNSVLFAIPHLSFEAPITSLVYSFLFGLILSVIIQISKNLNLVIGLHIFWNGLNLIFPFFLGLASLQVTNLVSVFSYLTVLFLISIIIISISVVLIKKDKVLKNSLVEAFA